MCLLGSDLHMRFLSSSFHLDLGFTVVSLYVEFGWPRETQTKELYVLFISIVLIACDGTSTSVIDCFETLPSGQLDTEPPDSGKSQIDER